MSGLRGLILGVGEGQPASERMEEDGEVGEEENYFPSVKIL